MEFFYSCWASLLCQIPISLFIYILIRYRSKTWSQNNACTGPWEYNSQKSFGLSRSVCVALLALVCNQRATFFIGPKHLIPDQALQIRGYRTPILVEFEYPQLDLSKPLAKGITYTCGQEVLLKIHGKDVLRSFGVPCFGR